MRSASSDWSGVNGSRDMRALRERMTTKSEWTHRRALLYEIFHPQSRCLHESQGGRGFCWTCPGSLVKGSDTIARADRGGNVRAVFSDRLPRRTNPHLMPACQGELPTPSKRIR